ncbi:MAG: hypothetical protein ACRCX2_23190 [Paraclostridium sp.]
MFKVDFEKLDPKIRRTVQAVESKPHVRYIRYLLTKKYSPIVIKKELQRLGLSAPHEPALITYYLSVMDPVIKEHGLSYLYADYKSRLLSKNKSGEYSKNILNYRLHLSDDLDGQVRLCKLIMTFEIEELWMKEIYKFHGSASTLPVDERGIRILSTTTSYRRSIDHILLSEKRYLIDKMLLESVPNTRIAQYCREKFKMNIQDYDIETYKRTFFNIQTQTIEDKIKYLECEKNSLETVLSDIKLEATEFEDLSIGERNSLLSQTTQRIDELTDNIKTLNMFYSEAAFRIAESNQQDFESMFTDVVSRAYTRFTQLDGYKDRDVVDPLFKTAKMMSFAHDKVEAIKVALKTANSYCNTDRHSQGVLMELYKKRIDEIADEQKERVRVANNDPGYGNVNMEDIEGIDELGLSFETGDTE